MKDFPQILKSCLIKINDLMQSASGNQLVENVFTDGRHLNLSVVFISQNLKLILYRKEMSFLSAKTYLIQERNAEPSL